MKIKTNFICQQCSYSVAKWLGKCPECHSWNTFEENIQKKSVSNHSKNEHSQSYSLPMDEFRYEKINRFILGLNEIDRVWGGGITLGSVTLLAGEPGIGKSTLLLKISQAIMEKHKEAKILYVSAEETVEQIFNRASRVGVLSNRLFLYHQIYLQEVRDEINQIKPDVLLIDSIQSIVNTEVNSSARSVSQLRENTFDFVNISKKLNIATILIGHVNKEGGLAGPKLIEHLVDTVIYIEGDVNQENRFLRSVKNRFGDTSEIGLLEMNAKGLFERSEQISEFEFYSEPKSYGKCRTCLMKGNRPMFLEIQALVLENNFNHNRRSYLGVEFNRVNTILAIIEKYFEINILSYDVYLSTTGGVKAKSPSIDLAILVAILSSYYKKPLSLRDVFMGELSLSGEVKNSQSSLKIVKEMERLGCHRLIYDGKKLSCSHDSKIELIPLHNPQGIKENIFCIRGC